MNLPNTDEHVMDDNIKRLPRVNWLCKLLALLSLTFLLSIPNTVYANDSAPEPKQLQRLYKCLDKKILKLSQKKKHSSADKVLKKCRKRVRKWMKHLPQEAHDDFMAQLTQSIELALEDARRGNFLADDDAEN